MGNCDWDDKYPPPKKCGYVGTWTGGGNGGSGWNIPPIDVDDDDWTPPPPIGVDLSWYCEGSNICSLIINGSPEAQAALSGPYNSDIECLVECSPTYKVLCTYRGTVHWQCETIMFGPGEVIPDYINIPGDLHDSMAACQADCPPESGPPVAGWQCDLRLEAGGAPECTLVTRGDVNDNGTYLHRTKELCVEDCKKGRWECNEALRKCFWNANAPKAVTLIEKNEFICNAYCVPPKEPDNPITNTGGGGCSYVYCDLEQDPPRCEDGEVTESTHPRLDAQGNVIEAHKELYREINPPTGGSIWRLNCSSEAMKSLIESLGGGCNDDNCPPRERPVTPPSGGTPPSAPATPQTGSYWYCNKSSYTCLKKTWQQSNIERDFPNDGTNDQLYTPEGLFRWDSGQAQRVADLFGGINDTGPEAKTECENECTGHTPATPGNPTAPSSPTGPGIKGSYLICVTKGEPCHQKWWYAENFPQTNLAYAWAYNSRGQWDASEEEMATFLEGFPDTPDGASACRTACALGGPSTDTGGAGAEDTTVRSGAWYECDPHTFTCFRVEWTQGDFPSDRYGSYWDSRGKFTATDDQVRLDHAVDGGQPDTAAGKATCQSGCTRTGSATPPGNEVGGELDVWYCELDGDCAMVTISVGREISDPNWVVPDNERGQPGFWGEGAESRCNADCPDPVEETPPGSPTTDDLRPDRYNCAAGNEGGCTSVSYGSVGWGAAWEDVNDCIENCPKKPPGGDDAQLPPAPSTPDTTITPGDDDLIDSGPGSAVTPDNPDEEDDIEQAAKFICNFDGTCSQIDDRHPEWDSAWFSMADCERNCPANPKWLCTREGCKVVDFKHPAYNLGFSTSLECQMACPPPPITDGSDFITDGPGDDDGPVDAGDHEWTQPGPFGLGGTHIDPDCVFGGTHIQWVCNEDTHKCMTVEVPINVTYFDDAISCLNYCNRNSDFDSEGKDTLVSFNNISNEGLHDN